MRSCHPFVKTLCCFSGVQKEGLRETPFRNLLIAALAGLEVPLILRATWFVVVLFLPRFQNPKIHLPNRSSLSLSLAAL